MTNENKIYRTCNTCGQVKPIENFALRKYTRVNGESVKVRRNICNSCAYKRTKAKELKVFEELKPKFNTGEVYNEHIKEDKLKRDVSLEVKRTVVPTPRIIKPKPTPKRLCHRCNIKQPPNHFGRGKHYCGQCSREIHQKKQDIQKKKAVKNFTHMKYIRTTSKTVQSLVLKKIEIDSINLSENIIIGRIKLNSESYHSVLKINTFLRKTHTSRNYSNRTLNSFYTIDDNGDLLIRLDWLSSTIILLNHDFTELELTEAVDKFLFPKGEINIVGIVSIIKRVNMTACLNYIVES